MRASLSLAFRVTLALGGSIASNGGLLAQVPTAAPVDSSAARQQHAKKSGKGWRLAGDVRLQAEYDDNLFLLSPKRKSDLASPSSGEKVSGRWDNMESAWDVIATGSAAVGAKGPGLAGRSLEILPELAYDLYTQNPERSNVRVGLALTQELWSDHRLRVEGEYTPSYFVKNYLADAVDQDGSQTISSDERIYRAGDYRDFDIGAEYRIPIDKSTKKHPFGAALQLDAGYTDRTFDDPFPGRDLNGPGVGAELLLDLTRKVSMDVGYSYTPLGATTTQEVVLLDEAGFGQDFNGNGNTTDNNVRVVTGVDRSRHERELATTLHLDLGKSDLAVGYQHRWRTFTSNEPLDVSNNGRDDSRNRWSADLRVRVAKDLRLRLGGTYIDQNTNRSGDPGSTGEENDFTRYLGRIGLSYEL